MMELPPAAHRVETTAVEFGLKIEIRIMPASTRTAVEAAEAVGAEVGQIVKSLIFKGKDSGKPYLLLVSGTNRVNENQVARHLGEGIDRPDADFVREATGFAIGGIPPLGFATPLRTWMDEDLLQYETVWAAAGTPNAVFSVDPEALRAAVGAHAIKVT
ncbi:MAG: YbaK/EbsC family protein [Rhizobiales bacterium]|nr:YbaK/EbsC family protein [Hyphomicrobiales bacterium]MBN9011035.1 YbaK/EbsC family protein [Hyphomicrobiales bacterium]